MASLDTLSTPGGTPEGAALGAPAQVVKELTLTLGSAPLAELRREAENALSRWHGIERDTTNGWNQRFDIIKELIRELANDPEAKWINGQDAHYLIQLAYLVIDGQHGKHVAEAFLPLLPIINKNASEAGAIYYKSLMSIFVAGALNPSVSEECPFQFWENEFASSPHGVHAVKPFVQIATWQSLPIITRLASEGRLLTPEDFADMVETIIRYSGSDARGLESASAALIEMNRAPLAAQLIEFAASLPKRSSVSESSFRAEKP